MKQKYFPTALWCIIDRPQTQKVRPLISPFPPLTSKKCGIKAQHAIGEEREIVKCVWRAVRVDEKPFVAWDIRTHTHAVAYSLRHNFEIGDRKGKSLLGRNGSRRTVCVSAIPSSHFNRFYVKTALTRGTSTILWTALSGSLSLSIILMHHTV